MLAEMHLLQLECYLKFLGVERLQLLVALYLNAAVTNYITVVVFLAKMESFWPSIGRSAYFFLIWKEL